MNDIFVRVIDLPATVPAVCALDSDGNYNIYINARLSYAQAREAWRHELQHIKRGHFFSQAPAWFCELEVMP